MTKLRPDAAKLAPDRRSGDDRRHVEGEPPGRHDRRRRVESRKPEVVELDMSSSEWAALNEPTVPTKKT